MSYYRMHLDVAVLHPTSSIRSNLSHSNSSNSNRHHLKLTFRVIAQRCKKWITSRYRGRSELCPYLISITWETKILQPRNTPVAKLFNHRAKRWKLIRVAAYLTKSLLQPVPLSKFSSLTNQCKIDRMEFSPTVFSVRMKQIWIMLSTNQEDKLRKVTY